MRGQIFLTCRISVGGNLLTAGFCFIPISGIPTLSCTERPEQKDYQQDANCCLSNHLKYLPESILLLVV